MSLQAVTVARVNRCQCKNVKRNERKREQQKKNKYNHLANERELKRMAAKELKKRKNLRK